MKHETLWPLHGLARRVGLGWRWLVIIVLIGGYAATFSKFGHWQVEYSALTLASLLACLLLLSVLNRPLEITAPVWLFLVLFLGAYYFKLYWMLNEPKIVSTVWFPHLDWIVDSPEIVVSGYATTTYAFIAFSLTAWLCIVLAKPLRASSPKRRIHYVAVASHLQWVISFLMAVTSYLMYITGIAIMGAESVYLPFRLAGLIYYTRVALIPALLLLLIWCSDEADLRKYVRAGIILLCLHGLSDILLRGSKGALLLLFISLGFLFLVTGRMTAPRAWFMISIGVLNILLWPLILNYRYLRDPTRGIIHTVVGAMGSVWQGEYPVSEALSGMLTGVLSRFTGIEGLLASVGVGFEPIGFTKLFDPMVERIFTIEVLGYSRDAIHGSAPGLLGWFYIVGGHYLAVVGSVSFVVLTWYFWCFLRKVRLICRPVAQALFLGLVFGLAMDGMLNYLGVGVVTTVGSIGVCELLVRNGRRLHWLKKPP